MISNRECKAHFIENTIIQDLIDGNAFVGVDGDIWYPSGPANVSPSKILIALVAKVKKLNSITKNMDKKK